MSDVSTVSIICKAQHEDTYLERVLVGGTKAIRKAGQALTPKYPGEDEETYKMRLDGATLFNGFEDTVRKMAGKVLAKDVVLGDDVPPAIKDLSSNIDGQGRNLTAFAYDAFHEAMIDGLSFIFVDFPRVAGVVGSDGIEQRPFLSDQIAQGARPNVILYLVNQVIGFKHENRAGAETLTQFRILENVIEPDGEYGETLVEQIRVLNIGSFELWRKTDDKSKDDWYLYDKGLTSLSYIPIVPVYTNRTGYFTACPPLKTLAEINLEHWISSTDQRKALTFARFAMMVFTGVQPGSIKSVGPDVVVELNEPNAKWGKIESSGEGIVAGRLDLEAIEKKMEKVGMVIQVQDAKGDITATAASIDSEEVNAALLAAAGALEDSLDQMLQIIADYQNLTSGGSTTVNKQFGRRKSTATVADLVSLYSSGLLDDLTVLEELQKRGDLSEDLEIEEIQRRVRENPPNLIGQGGNEFGNQGGVNDNNSL